MTSALRAFQRELDVTGHNLANVNTPGYTRQVTDLKSNDPTNIHQGRPIALGSGVSVASVGRIRDMFLEARRNEVGADQGRLSAQSEGLSGVEGIVADPSAPGIDDALTSFFDSFSALSSNPNQLGMRQQALQAGQTLANRIRDTYSQLQSLKESQMGQVGETVARINELGSGIAKLNEEIRQSVNGGGQPNDLLDKRDHALRELSTLADVKTQNLPDGTVSVSLNQLSLVAGADFRAMPTSPVDPIAGTIGVGDAKVDVRNGRLKGQFDALGGINSAQQRLDGLANAIRTGVNEIHELGTNAAGATDLKFFNDANPQTGAKDFDLDVAVKGKPEAIAAGTSGAAGDGDIALALSRLRNQGSAGLGGRTFGNDFADLVTQVGREVKAVDDALDTQNALATQVDTQLQSVSGVSMDEEMANMLRFQRSYQAAAKALSSFDSMFDDLLGMLR
ncbi:MAG: flagellar hook-associated protein FlgK [Fimbriimonas sp.]